MPCTKSSQVSHTPEASSFESTLPWWFCDDYYDETPTLDSLSNKSTASFTNELIYPGNDWSETFIAYPELLLPDAKCSPNMIDFEHTKGQTCTTKYPKLDSLNEPAVSVSLLPLPSPETLEIESSNLPLHDATPLSFESTPSSSKLLGLQMTENMGPATRRKRRRGSHGRVPHALVEQRYRNSVNAGLKTLESVLQNSVGLQVEDGKSALTKGAILNQACTYIQLLQEQLQISQQENEQLRAFAKRERSWLARIALANQPVWTG
ncbi:hypothetical protein BX600DRAFT_441758 [Xylariales sp. PMI_506]|nr:hypothetical protein BX600DRAFT_441758 [Xylariales sp. PMI_506]